MAVCSNLRKGKPPCYTVHFVCTSGTRAGRTAGCNKHLASSRYTPIGDAKTWKDMKDDCTLCTFCVTHYKLPKEWEDDTPPPKERDLDSPSESSESSDEDSWEEGPYKRPRTEDGGPLLPINVASGDKWATEVQTTGRA